MSGQYSIKREAILAAARQLLAEQRSGVGVRLDEVARRAGTSKATIYRYFLDKRALLAEAGFSEPEPGARERILDAAGRVIPRHGLDRVTMHRIAEEANVSPPTLYWHFRNKEDLLLAVVERLAQSINPPGLIGEPRSTDAPERALAAFMAVAMEAQAAHLDLFRTLLVEVGNRPELASVLYERVVGPLWGAVAAYMELQVTRGEFKLGHPLLRVVALAGMVTFYNLARRNFGRRAELPPPEVAAHDFLDIFLEGVRNDRHGS